MNSSSHPHIVIVGAVAGGASCAARLRRRNEFARITLIERGGDVSFANCGLPYYIGGEITDRSRLALQTAKSLSAMLGLNVRTHTEALRIDSETKTLRVRNLKTEQEEDLAYDKLVLAPGAVPLRPPLPGIEDPRIHTLRTLQDMDAIKTAAVQARNAVVIGAGFIGLEMTEQLIRLGLEVTLIEMQSQVLPQLDPEMTRLVEDALRDEGVRLLLGETVDRFSGDNSLTLGLASGEALETDLVVLSIGVRPENTLANAAGLELGARGHVVVNGHMQTSNPDIYAVGDVIEHIEPVFGKPAAVPLGGLANRQGRVAADHMVDGEKTVPYPGSLGTSIVRVFNSVAAVTGWTEKRLKAENISYRTTVINDFHHASYYPDAIPLSIKLLWSPETDRVIGAQVVGVEGVDKRIDVLATAITGKLTLDQLTHLELAYAPPFGSAKDPINLAGFSASNIRDGLVVPLFSIPEGGDHQIVDVRPNILFDLCGTPNAINIPLDELRKRLGELDTSRPVATVCAFGKTSYFAARILLQHGFNASNVLGGIRVCRDYSTPFKPPQTPKPQAEVTPVRIDATGISCPGPIYKLEQTLRRHPAASHIEIRATDPDFARDLMRFCQEYPLTLEQLHREHGVLTAQVARIMK
jgi:NADPH-dependent 2,4-dienoyl-CoA reductase/sulfur reductase-like enzyme/rhodanese-related sulfurtransferase/TusA-related sulfurtransferase